MKMRRRSIRRPARRQEGTRCSRGRADLSHPADLDEELGGLIKAAEAAVHGQAKRRRIAGPAWIAERLCLRRGRGKDNCARLDQPRRTYGPTPGRGEAASIVSMASGRRRTMPPNRARRCCATTSSKYKTSKDDDEDDGNKSTAQATIPARTRKPPPAFATARDLEGVILPATSSTNRRTAGTGGVRGAAKAQGIRPQGRDPDAGRPREARHGRCSASRWARPVRPASR